MPTYLPLPFTRHFDEPRLLSHDIIVGELQLVSYPMQVLKMAISSSGRHLRRLCGHCNEELSYSAYRSHKALYYVESEERWLTPHCDKDSGSSTVTTMPHLVETADDAGIIEDTQMDQTGNLNIAIHFL